MYLGRLYCAGVRSTCRLVSCPRSDPCQSPSLRPGGMPRAHLHAPAPGVELLGSSSTQQCYYNPAATTRRSSAAPTMLPASTQTLIHLPRTGEQILSSILFDSIHA